MYLEPTCCDCPYIKDEFDIRESYFENKLDDEPLISKSCYCDKIGGKIGWFGFCGDEEYVDTDVHLPYYHGKLSKYKHLHRLKSKAKYKNKLKRQSETLRFYPSPAYPVYNNDDWVDGENKIVYYKKNYKSSHSDRHRYYKRQSNRMIRRHFKTIETLDIIEYDMNHETDEYKEMYCDEFGFEYDFISVIDEDSKYGLGSTGSSYKKVFDYRWAID